MRRSEHRSCLAAALAFLALLSACTKPGDPAAPAPPSAGAGLADAGPSPDIGGALRRALLGPADVPSEYAPHAAPTPESYRADPAECARTLDEVESIPVAEPGAVEARTAFATADLTSWIQEILRAYPSGEASVALSRAADNLAKCHQVTIEYPDGMTFTESIDTATRSGDDFTVRVTLQAPAFSLADNLSVRRVGDVLIILSYTAPEAPDPASTEDLMARATDRLRAVVG
jgi:hypothetical protein